ESRRWRSAVAKRRLVSSRPRPASMPRKASQCGRSRPKPSTISSKTPGSGRYASINVARSALAWAALLAALVASLDLSKPSRAPQVEGHRIVKGGRLERRVIHPWRVAMVVEPRPTACLRLVGVDRIGLVVAPARMRHMIDAAAERSAA